MSEWGGRAAGAGAGATGDQPAAQPAAAPAAPKRSSLLESWRGFAGLITRGLRELLFMASESDARIAEHRLPRSIWMLGVRYDLGARADEDERAAAAGGGAACGGMQDFRRDMQSRLWFTYRCNLAPITGNITSDSGWGCMLRSGQMMFAQALLVHNLGRDWRLPMDPSYKDMPAGYRQVLEWFEDIPSAPFSVHAISRAGEKVDLVFAEVYSWGFLVPLRVHTQVGKRAGTWLGPNTVCSAFSRLHDESKCAETCGMQLLLLDKGDGDNTIYLDEASARLDAGPTLLLLPVRLGMHTIDASYIPKVAHVFSFPQSVGFIGGRPVSGTENQ